MTKSMRKLLVTGIVAGMCVVLLSGFAAAAGPNAQGYKIGQTLGGLRTAVAQALGWETEAVITARQDGQTLREILLANNIDVEKFVEGQVAARKEVMDQLVASGKMTAEQAENCLTNMAANLDRRLDSTTTCTGLGQGGSGGRNCGGGGRNMGRMMRQGFRFAK